MTSTTDIAELAALLDSAAEAAAPIAQLTSEYKFSLEEAYEVQRELVALRCARGDSLSGVKLGFTSRAKAQQMGVDDVIVGRITHGMRITDGGELDFSRYCHPRIEPEVAFRLGVEVDPQDETLDAETVVEAVAPALEVIDSRYRDFRFTLEDVVADNTSAAAYVIGPWTAYGQAGDLANRGVTLDVDGEVAETGSTAAILGHPLRAVHAAQRMARTYGLTMPAGTVILAGAATAAVPLRPGRFVETTVTGLGSVGLRVSGDADV
ncbi:2-keto-4-pentenoate hydratase [Streptomyces sp. NPDC057654]|uniref:2-keto-4-pentenoate hydratase n=1 Tax=Streptomyces sp. NPDC057654 TaxID=3346196 RepID=UPI0036A74E8D